MLSLTVKVLDPAVEPGQNVPVRWEISRSYVDTNLNGTIQAGEVLALSVSLEFLGSKNHLQFTPILNADCYIDRNGNLVGITPVSIQVDAQSGASFTLWAAVSNGVNAPLIGKSSAVTLVGNAIAGTSTFPSPFGSNYRLGAYGAASTTLTAPFSIGLPSGGNAIQVASSTGFPSQKPFDVWISSSIVNGGYARVSVTGSNGNVWTVTPKEISAGLIGRGFILFPAGSTVALDPIDNYAQQAGISREDILDYAETINGPPVSGTEGHVDRDIASESVRSLLARSAAMVELRAAHAVNDPQILNGDLGQLKNKLPDVLKDVFLGAVRFAADTPWNPSLPTAVLVHGIRVSPDGEDGFFSETVDRLGLRLKGKANVLGFTWGETGLPNGLDRSIGDVLTSANEVNDKGVLLQGAVNLNKVLRYLDRSYQQAGTNGAAKVSVIAHSEGTVLVTAAMSLDPTELNSSFAFGMKQALFMGATVENTGADLFNYFPNLLEPQRPLITNLYSASDEVLHQTSRGAFVVVGAGTAVGLGYDGLQDGFNNPIIQNTDFDTHRLSNIDAVHTGPLRVNGSQFYAGWWEWLLTFQDLNSFVATGASGPDGFAGAARQILKHGAIFFNPLVQVVDLHDIPDGYGKQSGPSNLSPLQPTLQLIQFSSPDQLFGAGADADDEVGIGIGAGDPPSLIVRQGRYFIAEAVGAVDPDGYIFRADFYRDVNGNGLPDDNDQEYLGTDFHAGNGWKRAIYTRDWAVGNYDIFAQVFDNGGNASNLKVATIAIIDPSSPPGPLPLTFDNTQRPQFNIFPHRNGDVSYDVGLFSLAPGTMDLFQITPQAGGGFDFETTGDTDTVLGLYDWATGALLASDQDNGSANNSEIIYTLAAGHTYMLIVASQRGDSGAYGLDVTGANQTITATPIFTAPRYETAVAESISTPFELDYFKAAVPATTTTLVVTLDVTTALDGWVRVENAAHETLATAFLGTAGVDESLSATGVTPGEDVFITVAALAGTTGAYTLNLDFGPDEAGLPATLGTLPAAQRIVALPDGTFTLASQSIATAGQFRYYVISARQNEGGSFTFETFGNLDTQIGVYRMNLLLLGSDDDSGGGENARLSLDLNAGEDYIIVVRGEGNDTGNFDLSVGGPAASVQSLVISGLASAAASNFMFFTDSYRFYHFEAVAPANATKVAIWTPVVSGSAALDLSVRVSDSNGNVLATANTYGPGKAELISDLAIAGGETYLITVYSENYTNGTGLVNVDFDPNFTVGSGSEFPVNSSFFGDQTNPDVAQNSIGQTIAVWRFSDLQRVDAQRFDANNQPVGGEIHINSQPLQVSSVNPAVGIANSGSFVVLFGDDSGLFYRVFDSNANPLTGDVNVGFSATNIDIAVEPNGRFMIVGTNINQIVGRVFDAAGNPLTGPLVLHTTSGNLVHPSIAADGQGRYVISWFRGTESINNIHAMRVDTLGNVVTSAFLVAPEFAGFPSNPVVSSHGDGTFVVAFDGDPLNGTGRNIYARRFNENANPESDLLLLNTVTAGDQTEPEVALLSQGKFLVAWKGTDSNGAGIRAQQIGVNLERIGPEFTLNKVETGTQQKIALWSDGNKKISAVWEGPDADGKGIFGLSFTMAEIKEPELTVTETAGVENDRFVNFGSQVAQVGGTIPTFAPATVTIKNDGNASLVVSAVDVYGADAASFVLSDSSGFTLNPGQSRAIVVTFTGRKLGDNYANLRLDHNDNSDILSGDFDADPYWVSLLARIDSPFAGDYDVDGDVDQGDYDVWRTSFGEAVNLQADGNNNGIVDGADYVVWRKNRGATFATHTISAARQATLGSTITVSGVVTTTTDLVDSPLFRNFFIQDATGGIVVFGTNAQIESLLTGVTDGDSIAITGRTDAFFGSLELDGTDGPLSLIKTGHPGIPQPTPVTATTLKDFSSQAETLEGMLVKLSGVSFVATGTFAGAQNYTVTDGAIQAIVRVSTTQQNIVGTPIPTGPVDLIGILSQYDSTIPTPGPGVPGKGYQLLLRTVADIVSSGAGAGIVGIVDQAGHGASGANFEGTLPPPSESALNMDDGVPTRVTAFEQQPAEENANAVAKSQVPASSGNIGQASSSVQPAVASTAPIEQGLTSRIVRRIANSLNANHLVDSSSLSSKLPASEPRLGVVGAHNRKANYTAHHDASLAAWSASVDRIKPHLEASSESIETLSNFEDVPGRSADEPLHAAFHAVDRVFDDIFTEV